ncbi:hypothetical protein SARC_01982, partial [Sphaeroforma arctica JP610]
TIPVTVRGDAMPRQIMGRLHAVFAYLRMCYVAMLLVFGLDGLETHPYDIIFCDQVSACIPILRLSESKCGISVLFLSTIMPAYSLTGGAYSNRSVRVCTALCLQLTASSYVFS